MNREYLNYIRENSAYPTFRSFVSVVASILVVLSILVGLSGLFVGVGTFIFTALFGIFLFVIIKISVELSLILADTADATVERSGRDWTKQKKTVQNVNEVHSNQPQTEPSVQDVVREINATCPACGTDINSEVDSCPKCKAIFSADSAWKPKLK